MACMTIVPGHHMTQFSKESSEDMPVTVDDETELQRLNINTITAELIVNLEKDLSNFSSDPNNVANHYFDYRIGSKTKKGTPEKETYIQYLVGPRDILKITVWG
ncbi:MAG: polysaccharide export protein, partial [Desulfobulbia bacterium]